jgi:hypothetical protein
MLILTGDSSQGDINIQSKVRKTGYERDGMGATALSIYRA